MDIFLSARISCFGRLAAAAHFCLVLSADKRRACNINRAYHTSSRTYSGCHLRAGWAGFGGGGTLLSSLSTLIFATVDKVNDLECFCCCVVETDPNP